MKFLLTIFILLLLASSGSSQIYPADGPGVPLTVGTNNLGEKSDWKGYLTISEIRLLMMKDPAKCVGLRIYDLEIDPRPKIIVTPIDENGFELGTQSYFINHVPEDNGETGEFVSRATAKTIAEQNKNNSEEQFVSFFSLAMLEQLISQGATGVAFFGWKVPLSVEMSESDMEVLKDKSPPSEFATHSAFPAEIKNGKVSLVSNRGVVSDIVCPGHCADLEDVEDLSTLKSTTSVHGFMTDGIYLIRW